MYEVHQGIQELEEMLTSKRMSASVLAAVKEDQEAKKAELTKLQNNTDNKVMLIPPVAARICGNMTFQFQQVRLVLHRRVCKIPPCRKVSPGSRHPMYTRILQNQEPPRPGLPRETSNGNQRKTKHNRGRAFPSPSSQQNSTH